MRFYPLVVALALAGAALVGPRPGDVGEARAAVSVAYSLDELTLLSPLVVVARAVEKKSQWEQVAGSRRIVTYTRLAVVETVYGGEQPAPVWVRTLGGAVGKIGQQVGGEARLRIGEQALLFLVKSRQGVWVVSGMAQGHFPVREVERTEHGKTVTVRELGRSPSLGTVLRRRGPTISAQEVLVGATVSEAVTKIRAAKARLDAQRKQK